METKEELRNKIYNYEKEIAELKEQVKKLSIEKKTAVDAAILNERNHQYKNWLRSKEGKWIQNLINTKINEAMSQLSLSDYSHGDAYYSVSGINLQYKGKTISSIDTDSWESEG